MLINIVKNINCIKNYQKLQTINMQMELNLENLQKSVSAVSDSTPPPVSICQVVRLSKAIFRPVSQRQTPYFITIYKKHGRCTLKCTCRVPL